MQRKPNVNTGGSNLDDFINGAKDVKTEGQGVHEPEHDKKKTQQTAQNEDIDLEKLRRQTYYISELHIQAIEQMAFYEKMDKSEIVRKALEEFIPSKYITLAVKR